MAGGMGNQRFEAREQICKGVDSYTLVSVQSARCAVNSLHAFGPCQCQCIHTSVYREPSSLDIFPASNDGLIKYGYSSMGCKLFC